jgi:hypothetical protein
VLWEPAPLNGYLVPTEPSVVPERPGHGLPDEHGAARIRGEHGRE